MGTISDKLTYLNGTKQAIKTAINEDFEVIDDNTTFREYADEISSNNTKYKALIPTETKSATNNVNISNSAGIEKALVTLYGNTEQETTTGKNLLNPNLKQNGDRGITGTYNSDTGEITITGTPTAVFSNIGNRVDFPTPLPAGTYTLSTEKVENIRIGLHLYKSGGDIDNYAIFLGDKELQITVTDEITGYYLYIYGLGSNKQYNQSFKAMFESGSTATKWEKHTGGNPAPNPDYPQEIVNISGTSTLKDVGKQLFNKLTAEVGKYVTDNGSLGNSATFSASDYIQVVRSNTYTYSGCHMYDSFASGGAYYDENKDFVSSFKMQYSGTITIPQNAKYVRFSMRHAENDEDTFMFEQGSTASPYEAYKEESYTINLGNIELCKINTYKDRIYPLNDKWYLEKNINKVVLNGSETWTLPQTNTNTLRFNCEQGLVNGLDTGNMKIISNKFINGTSQNDNGDYEHIRSAVTGYPNMIAICVNKTRLSSQNINGFKTWLSNNNIIVYYIAEPTTEEITENNYPTLYNQLNNIKLYEGVNHITITNESGLDVEFDIEYYKNWKLD